LGLRVVGFGAGVVGSADGGSVVSSGVGESVAVGAGAARELSSPLTRPQAAVMLSTVTAASSPADRAQRRASIDEVLPVNHRTAR
jgi:hypothetical protein